MPCSPLRKARPLLNTVEEGFLEGVQDGSVIAGVSGVWNAVAMEEAWGADYGASKLPTYTCAERQIQMASFSGYKLIGVTLTPSITHGPAAG